MATQEQQHTGAGDSRELPIIARTVVPCRTQFGTHAMFTLTWRGLSIALGRLTNNQATFITVIEPGATEILSLRENADEIVPLFDGQHWDRQTLAVWVKSIEQIGRLNVETI